MEKKLVALVFIALLAGLVGGYGLGFVIYQPQILGFQSDISSLQSELSSLSVDYSTLNSTYNELKTNYQDLNATYNELKTLLKSDLPLFTIVDFRITRENFFAPSFVLGITTYVTIQNIGEADAHDVYVTCEDLFVNHTGNIRFGGETKLDILESLKSEALIIPFRLSGVGGGIPKGINITIASKEGITQSFIYNYEIGAVYGIKVENISYTEKYGYRGFMNYTFIEIRNMGNWSFNYYQAVSYMANGSYLNDIRGYRSGLLPIGGTFTIELPDKFPYAIVWLLTDYNWGLPTDRNWIHIIVDTRNV